MQCKQMGPVVINGSVHTECKQHQRNCIRICVRVTSRVLCELDPKNGKFSIAAVFASAAAPAFCLATVVSICCIVIPRSCNVTPEAFSVHEGVNQHVSRLIQTVQNQKQAISGTDWVMQKQAQPEQSSSLILNLFSFPVLTAGDAFTKITSG